MLLLRCYKTIEDVIKGIKVMKSDYIILHCFPTTFGETVSLFVCFFSLVCEEEFECVSNSANHAGSELRQQIDWLLEFEFAL